MICIFFLSLRRKYAKIFHLKNFFIRYEFCKKMFKISQTVKFSFIIHLKMCFWLSIQKSFSRWASFDAWMYRWNTGKCFKGMNNKTTLRKKTLSFTELPNLSCSPINARKPTNSYKGFWTFFAYIRCTEQHTKNRGNLNNGK